MNTYAPVWHKYRPAILKMMMDSTDAPQQYRLSDHEFKALNPRQKGGYTFCLTVNNSKAISGLKDSAVAQDLWEVLKLSPKGSSLISDGSYEFSLDKGFVLTITKINGQENQLN
jgi:hypothetical protein